VPGKVNSHNKKAAFWNREREKKLLDLFRYTVKRVPAYRKFLTQKGIDPKKIKTYTDFQAVPSMSKKDYLRAHPLNELCIDGRLDRPLVFTSTSGSTGEPFYFPRSSLLDEQFSRYCEAFFKNTYVKNQSTLVIIGFGMGVWIGGLITYEAFNRMSQRGMPLSVITPGVNKKEIYDAMRNIAPEYDRIILCGYPPFIKDVIDDGKANGVDWKKHNMKLLFAAESFSEKFRDYLARMTGMKSVTKDTMNIYGSADLGGMAQETPIAILARRLALKNKAIYKKLFNEATRLPTLAQYNPHFINFESQDKRIFVSGMNSLPLVRYEIGDNGGTLSFDEVEKIFKSEGIDLRAEARMLGVEKTVNEWPFVYVYERTDLSTKLYGAIIYPEYVKAGLEHPVFENLVTGKFAMSTRYDQKQDEYLEINIELKSNIEPTDDLNKQLTQAISVSLKENSAEHANNVAMLGAKVEPRIVFWPHEHSDYFRPGIKQKWVKK
jgi:phenylacetate-CoA ligase